MIASSTLVERGDRPPQGGYAAEATVAVTRAVLDLERTGVMCFAHAPERKRHPRPGARGTRTPP